MRKFTLCLLTAILGVVLSAHAQVQIGSSLAGLNLGLSGNKAFSFEIQPKAIFFAKDNVAVGGYVDFGVATSKDASTSIKYGYGTLGRYYTKGEPDAVKQGRFFAEGTAGLGGQNGGKDGTSTNGLAFGIGPGFSYLVTSGVVLETLLKYDGLVGFGSAIYQHNLSLSFGFQVRL